MVPRGFAVRSGWRTRIDEGHMDGYVEAADGQSRLLQSRFQIVRPLLDYFPCGLGLGLDLDLDLVRLYANIDVYFA